MVTRVLQFRTSMMTTRKLRMRKTPKFAECVGLSNNVFKLRNLERRISKLNCSNFAPRQKLLELPSEAWAVASRAGVSHRLAAVADESLAPSAGGRRVSTRQLRAASIIWWRSHHAQANDLASALEKQVRDENRRVES